MIFERTFHPDEANQAFTVGKLLEAGQYAYQPEDHHGPTLYYAAATLQKAFGHDSTATLDGTLLRCTPLVFAVATLVFGFLALRKLLAFSGSAGRLAPPEDSPSGWGEPSSASLNASNVLRVPNGFNALKALTALCFVLLLATSPIFVFFATDFIQEMLLTCFTMMMFWAGTGYLLPGGRWKPGTWALTFGIAAGLAFATKETSLVSFAAAFLAFVCLKVATRNSSSSRTSRVSSNLENLGKTSDSRLHFILALAGFLLTAILFYSSFCSNWQGVYNAFVAAPLSYLHRATGSAASTGAAWHVHPWWQYLEWLFLGKAKISQGEAGPHIYTATSNMQIGITALLCCGIPLLFRRVRQVVSPALLRTAAFLALYTVLLLIFYSAIPYKTPWCTLQIHVGYILTSFVGILVFGEIIAAVSRWYVRRLERTAPTAASRKWTPSKDAIMFIVATVIVATTIAVEYRPQLVRMFRDPDSKDIPYNYAAASPEVKELAATVAAAMNPASSDIRHSTTDNPHSQTPFIAVALPPADTWPFPWYNRPYEPQTGYWTDFAALRKLAEAGAKPTVVIVPMEEGHLVQPLFPYLKKTKRFYMRPGVRVRVFWTEDSD